MAQVFLTTGYTFVKGAANVGTITFPNPKPANKAAIKMIFNVQTAPAVVIYNFDKAGLGGTYAAGVLTLEYSTNSMSNSDQLLIIYDDGDTKQLASISATFARPADTIAYLAGDSVSNSTSSTTPMTFANALRHAGATAYIVGALLMTDQAANISRFRLHLFSDTPGTPAGDNVPTTFLWTNRDLRLPEIDFSQQIVGGAGSTATFASLVNLNIPINGNGSSRDIFGLLQTIDGFTPASGQNLFVKLLIEWR